jgi:hypothetical protein
MSRRWFQRTALCAAIVSVALAGGCAGEGGDGGDPEPGDTAASTGSGDTIATDSPDVAGQTPAQSGPAAIAARWAARLPEDVRVRRGACPFECCIYRDWTSRAAYDVFAQERGEGAPAFSIPAGTTFHADSGNVHITGVSLVAVADSVSDGDYWAFGAGDTLVVLDYIGEGHYNVWHDGEVRDVAGFWGAEQTPAVAEQLGSYESQWWVHITLADGRTGWIRNDPPREIDGADRCAD